MVSFENLKKVPKLDLHINFLSSITTNLAFDLNDDLSIDEVMDMSTIKRFNEYDKCLEIPIKLLNNVKNIKIAVLDLINRLKKNNVIYGELFLDLPLYNRRFSLEYLIEILLKEIKKESFDLQLVLCVSDKLSKEDNLEVLSLLDKYYGKGVNGVYFQKDKSTNLADYIYVFDKLMRNNISYIVPFDEKITNQNRDIYAKASRIEYLLDGENEELLNLVQENNIMLEFSLTKIQELGYNYDIYNFIYKLIKDNYLVVFNSLDMTILNTDIINEYCLLFNNCELTLLEMVKLLINSINHLTLDLSAKERLIKILKDESNQIL